LTKNMIGMPLPSFFFAKLLNRRITLADLNPDEDRYADLQLLKMNHIKGDEGYSAEHTEFSAVFGKPILITQSNVEEIIQKVCDSFMPAAMDNIMDAIRAGFEVLVPIGELKILITPRDLKLRIAGPNRLDIENLKRLDLHEIL